MENRLPWQRLLPHSVMMVFILCFSFSLQSQSFTFSFTGADTLTVGNDCTVALAFGHPDSINFTSVNGNKIDTFYIDTISGGYSIGDMVSLGETIFVSYFVADTTGFSEVLDSIISIAIIDAQAPIFDSTSTPNDTTYQYLSEVTPIFNVPLPTAIDSCSTVTVQFTAESTPPSPCDGGTFTRTWIASDTSGNSSTYIQTITIEKDTTPPTWTTNPDTLMIMCGVDIDVESTISTWLLNTGSGSGVGIAIDSSNVFLTNDYMGLIDECGSTPIIFSATDSCGNTSTRQGIIEIIDDTAPTIDVSARDTTVYCGTTAITFADWMAIHGNASASDFCTDIDNSDTSAFWSVVDIDTVGNTCGDTASYTVIFEVKDNCGNADSTTATYSSVDTVGPIIVGLIADTTEICDEEENDLNKVEQWFDHIRRNRLPGGCTGDATFLRVDYTDRDGVTGTWLSLAVPFPNIIPKHDCNWYLDGVFVFRDACGRIGTDTARFSLIDTIQPVLANVPMDTSMSCDQISIVPMNITATDNCDTSLVITVSESMDTTATGVTVIRTWVAMDDCNNMDTASQIITLIDTLAPVITNFPADTIVACDAIPAAPTGPLTAMDDCTDASTITFTFKETSNQQIHPDSCQTYSYTITRTWIVTDLYNNSDSSSQLITVVDTVAPTFTIPADTMVSCELRDSISITGQPTNMLDNCDTLLNLSYVDLVSGGDCIGTGILDTIRRTWIVMDACGNMSKDTQLILLIDTIAPVIIGQTMDTILQCEGGVVPLPVIGTDIIATDNCTNSPIIQFLGETNNQDTSQDSCDFYNYEITRMWRATDGCGNTADFTQTITIIDTIAPTIICPQDLIVANDSGTCESIVTLPLPFYFDNCTGISGNDSFNLSQNFTHPSGTDANSTAVDPLIFNFNIGDAAPNKTITSDITLTINLNSVDGEGTNEIFSILGEDGTVFAGTNPSNAQCGNSTTMITINSALANTYAMDSVITITLMPNDIGTDAINNICSGGNANLIMEYDYESPSTSIQLSYRIDGGAETVFTTSPTPTFAFGNHTITYFVADCSGNKDSCDFMVTIEDRNPPTFDCPSPMTVYTDINDCESEVMLPFPSNFNDNCGFANSFDNTINKAIVFTTDANAGNVPADIINTFQIATPNAVGDATLTVSVLGDNKDAGEFFNIYGESGVLLGTTVLGDTTSECTSFVSTMLTINKDTLNTWAADGQIIITAIANLDAANFSDFINPCDTLLSTQTDGKSAIAMNLNFPSVEVNYEIIDEDSVLIGAGILTSSTTGATEDLSVGIHTVTYVVKDAADNIANCQFTIEVKDTMAPIVVCNPNFVLQTNPSGVAPTDLSLMTDSLITNLNDNCGIETITVTPNEISCNDAGLVTIEITVTDSSGNTASCQTDIQVITETLTPSFSVGACDNDTLYLFADTTFQVASAPNTVFTYSWTGPNSFASNTANPIIPNVSAANTGTYSLTITGATGCTSSGNVFVDINTIDAPPIMVSSNMVCTSDGITLTTTSVSCSNLEYQWYEVIERNNAVDTIIIAGTTTTPIFNIAAPTAGRHAYYVIIKCDDCSSSGSSIETVTVFAVPAAVTQDEIINICEGETITLGTPANDPNCTYKWTGPGYTSDLANPAPITNATDGNEGVYTLTVSKNGCTSEAAFTVVNITERPAKPIIANDSGSIICEGEELVLKTNITNASTFNWTNASTFATYTTTTPELRIDTTTVQDGGLWKVSVASFDCESEESETINVLVEAKPNGTPFFEGNACAGRTIRLNVNPVVAGLAYEWMDIDGNTYLGANPEVPVKGRYFLTITSVNGCSNTRVLDVEISETPRVTTIFDTGDAVPCITPDATDIRIIADVFPANDGSYTYTWTTPDGTVMAPIADSILLIPNASSASANGTYTLVVNTGAGCTSNPATNIVEVADIPVPNPTITANATALCEGQTLILTATEYPNISAQYRWQITSIMDTITQSPVLVLDNITTALNGVVMVQVFNGICPSASTASLEISVNSPLAQPVVNPLSAFCTGEVITLTTAAVQGATYLWEGPNFSATSSTPDIVVAATATLQNNGGYTVQVLSNGCTSPKSEPLVVKVNSVPNAPIAKNSGDICLDNITDIILFVEDDAAPAGTEYRWFNAANSELIAGPNSFKSQIIEVGNLPIGTYSFYVTQTINGCQSAASNNTEVTLFEKPTEVAAVCESDIMVCDANEALICAIAPTQGIGTWTTNDATITINNPNDNNATVSGIRPGNSYDFVWTLSNGICGNYSSANLTVTVGVTGSIAKVCSPLIEECEGNTVNLCANPVPAGFQGTWSQSASQVALGVTIDNPNASNSTVSTIEPGLPYNAYTFFWTVIDDAGVCPATDTVQVNVYAIPGQTADITDDELISCNGEAVITAIAAGDGLTGTWSSTNPAIGITSPNSSSTTISNLSPGMNILVWSLNSGACMDYSSDEIIVFYEESPLANNDVFDIGFNGSATINVVENDDIFSPEFDITVVSSPSNGTAAVDGDGNIIFTVNQNFAGTDSFTYELCNPTCASDCSTATVELRIGDDAECRVPSIMTPNGDGINDALIIPCIETGNFPRNEVIIFNQWGDEIYRSAPYNNDWQGTYNGEDIPAGTYYYVISFDRQTEPSAGFLIIER